jgi:hypothetical protein
MHRGSPLTKVLELAQRHFGVLGKGLQSGGALFDFPPFFCYNLTRWLLGTKDFRSFGLHLPAVQEMQTRLK